MRKIRDIILVKEIRDGNSYAFTELFEFYAPRIIYKLSRGNKLMPDLAEDFVLEAALDLYENIVDEKYEEKGLFAAYLYKLAHNRYKKYLRKEVEICTEDDHIERILSDFFPDESMREIYLQAAVKAMASLSELCRDIIILKYYNNFRDSEIISEFPELENESNVRKRRSKCMTKLRMRAKNCL